MNPSVEIEFQNMCVFVCNMFSRQSPTSAEIEKNTPPPPPPPCHYTASTWTGVLLIYIITNVPIPLYQVNYAPYLILILLWEPGSASPRSGGNHQVSIRSSSPLVSASLESVCLRHRTVSSCPFQQTTASSLLIHFLCRPEAILKCWSHLLLLGAGVG